MHDNYEIKDNLFRTKKILLRNGKRVLVAPFIAQYAPSADPQISQDYPLFVVQDKEGKYSLFNAKSEHYYISNATSNRPFYRDDEKSLVPMTFVSETGETYYFSPYGTRHKISSTEELMFALQETPIAKTLRPTHDLVFVLKDGVPKILHKNPSYDIVSPAKRIGDSLSLGMISRYNHLDAVNNIYLPLMIRTLPELDEFTSVCNPTQKDWAALRNEYIKISTTKFSSTERKHEIGSSYLHTIHDKFEKIATENGTYNPRNIPVAVKVNTSKIRMLNERINSGKHAILKEEFELARETASREDFIADGYSKNYETIEMLDMIIDSLNKNIRTYEQSINQSDVEIRDLTRSNQELWTRSQCIDYTTKMGESIAKLDAQHRVAAVSTAAPVVENKQEVAEESSAVTAHSTTPKHQ